LRKICWYANLGVSEFNVIDERDIAGEPAKKPQDHGSEPTPWLFEIGPVDVDGRRCTVVAHDEIDTIFAKMVLKIRIAEWAKGFDKYARVGWEISFEVTNHHCTSELEFDTLIFSCASRDTNVLERVEEGHMKPALPRNELAKEALNGVDGVQKLEAIWR
jgi:hypothetical protein